MSPTHNQVEVDLDRKEELILAKQLRACRVQILPKVQLSSNIVSKKVFLRRWRHVMDNV